MNTGLSGYFFSTSFSSHLSKSVSICLYKLSEQSHLSNVAAETHKHREVQPAPVSKGTTSALPNLWLPSSVPRRSNWPPPDLLQSCCPSHLKQWLPPSKRKSRGETGGDGVSGELFCIANNFQLFSSFMTSSVYPLHNWMCPCACTVRSLQGILLPQRCHVWLRAYLWQAQENWQANLDSCWGPLFQETSYQSHLLAHCCTVMLWKPLKGKLLGWSYLKYTFQLVSVLLFTEWKYHRGSSSNFMPSLSHLHWVPLICCPLPQFPHPHPFQASPHSGIFSNNLQTPDYDMGQSRVLTIFTNILYYQVVGAGDTSSGQIFALDTLRDSLSTGVKIPDFSVHVIALSSPPHPWPPAGHKHLQIFISPHVTSVPPETQS